MSEFNIYNLLRINFKHFLIEENGHDLFIATDMIATEEIICEGRRIVRSDMKMTWSLIKESKTLEENVRKIQIGGSHYKDMVIQPFEYIYQNKIGFAEGCAIKYLSRWRNKNGVEDLKKARHFIDLLIEAENEKK